MPSLMIHLLTAYKLKPGAPPLFWVGNVAPDALNTWPDKDKTHFRDVPDREPHLKAAAKRIAKADHFQEGALLHLFLDWRWDLGPLERFKAHTDGTNWLKPYRAEISEAGVWLFHNKAWCSKMWADMAACDAASFGELEQIRPEDISDLITRNLAWHRESVPKRPRYFTPDFIERFTADTAREYAAWRRDIPRAQ